MIARILDDQYLHTANLLVCAGTLATPVGALTAVGTVVAGALSLKEVAKRMRPEQKGMAGQIAKLLKEKTAEQTHLKGDTAISLPDMVAVGMPSAQTIIDTKQQTKPLIDAMVAHLAKLGQPDYTLSQNVTAFRAVLHPVFEKLLNDAAFTAQLGPLRERIILEIPDMLREMKGGIDRIEDGMAEILAHLKSTTDPDALPLADLQKLAVRFGLPEDADKATLLPLLRDKAIEYAALKSEVDAIPETMRNLANLKAAAQDAIERVDLEEVENLMAMVHETELEEAAKSSEIRANTALLRGKVEDAYRYLSAAADSFAAVDPLEPARKRIMKYSGILRKHGLRYGDDGLRYAAELLNLILDAALNTADPPLWAEGQNILANALQEQGIRTLGVEGTDLLTASVTAYRRSLEARNRTDHPLEFAMTLNNLANALSEQGIRTQGADRADLLAQAVTACRSILEVINRVNRPVEWAMTQNNLATALTDQGIRTQRSKGADVLAEAIIACRSALEVRTRVDYPEQWAMTQKNLGSILAYQGTHTKGAEGTGLLAQAVTAFRNALEVQTRADHPVDWAMTQENIAICEKTRADHDSCNNPLPHLTAALEAVDNALIIYDPEHMSYNHAKATDLRDDIQAKVDALPPA
ncbi:hypothetical protein [uncultured Sulfitobacter sp.]|uniref:hypothetical protein n=1 Tax=uncultured Sulfitobacter sp. TaxID=191468 RepID=UPI002630B6B4|nr:hypothetical protein [uncultured Sulfitobacter sp.]